MAKTILCLYYTVTVPDGAGSHAEDFFGGLWVKIFDLQRFNPSLINQTF